MPGALGGMVAQGMALGTGSAMAHMAVTLALALACSIGLSQCFSCPCHQTCFTFS
mgnify:CR=1 FL=1